MADRCHPLADLAAASPDSDQVRLTALPPVGRLIIRGNAASIGLPLPDPQRFATAGTSTLLWLGPDEFLLLSDDDSVPSLPVRPLAAAVDVSHRDTSLAVSGPRAAWVINTFCALDLYPTVFPVGMCTRTVLGRSEIILWHTEDTTYRLEVARSFAPYVWACLEEARREFVAPSRSC